MTLLLDFNTCDMTFINQLTALFEANANPEFAAGMKSYMRSKFDFYGIKADLRRELLKKAIASCTADVANDPRQITKQLYKLPQRELHMCAMEIFEKELRKKYVLKDIVLIEKLITTNSWWDSVDFIAKNILGKYLMVFPEQTTDTISKFSKSPNLWLNRSTLIFQLGYKKNTNEQILFQQCLKFKHSNEFFIRKAIGWALREYAKTNSISVLNFVNSTQLKPLSKKEAIRNIIK